MPKLGRHLSFSYGKRRLYLHNKKPMIQYNYNNRTKRQSINKEGKKK